MVAFFRAGCCNYKALIACVLLLLSRHVHGQPQSQVIDLVEIWNAETNGLVLEGNGAFLAPTGDLLAVVSRASVSAFNPQNGEQRWTHVPLSPLSQTNGGIVFSYEGISPYLVYASVANFRTTVTALDAATGASIFEVTVDGSIQGTPVTTSDGRFILLNVNTDSNGSFYLLDINDTEEPVFQYTNSRQFGEIGYIWNPPQGYG